MEHILKLKPKYFNYINKGTKIIELRLYDEKRQKISIGDTIIF
jgi:ASC-1-like (ASCH) protein